MLPAPQYVIFYNGMKEEPDRTELSLSQSFLTKNKKLVPCIELTATVININREHNEKLLKQCGRLREYAEFVGRVRDNLAGGGPLEEAVGQAVNSCIRDGILAEFLLQHRAEVCEVILTEYDEQKHIASEKEVSREEEQDRYSSLILHLAKDKREDLIVKAAANRELLMQLYQEYGL